MNTTNNPKEAGSAEKAQRPSTLIDKARQEVNNELEAKAVEKLKVLIRQEKLAYQTLSNIQREIRDAELQIEQGNL